MMIYRSNQTLTLTLTLCFWDNELYIWNHNHSEWQDARPKFQMQYKTWHNFFGLSKGLRLVYINIYKVIFRPIAIDKQQVIQYITKVISLSLQPQQFNGCVNHLR